jgi:hypothetical protein
MSDHLDIGNDSILPPPSTQRENRVLMRLDRMDASAAFDTEDDGNLDELSKPLDALPADGDFDEEEDEDEDEDIGDANDIQINLDPEVLEEYRDHFPELLDGLSVNGTQDRNLSPLAMHHRPRGNSDSDMAGSLGESYIEHADAEIAATLQVPGFGASSNRPPSAMSRLRHLEDSPGHSATALLHGRYKSVTPVQFTRHVSQSDANAGQSDVMPEPHLRPPLRTTPVPETVVPLTPHIFARSSIIVPPAAMLAAASPALHSRPGSVFGRRSSALRTPGPTGGAAPERTHKGPLWGRIKGNFFALNKQQIAAFVAESAESTNHAFDAFGPARYRMGPNPELTVQDAAEVLTSHPRLLLLGPEHDLTWNSLVDENAAMQARAEANAADLARLLEEPEGGATGGATAPGSVRKDGKDGKSGAASARNDGKTAKERRLERELEKERLATAALPSLGVTRIGGCHGVNNTPLHIAGGSSHLNLAGVAGISLTKAHRFANSALIAEVQAEVASHRQQTLVAQVYAPSVLCGERAPTTPADGIRWWEGPEARAVSLRAISEMPYVFDEYVHFHVQAVALLNVRRMGQWFTPYVALQRQRRTTNGGILWDTVASTEPNAVLLSDPSFLLEKKRDLAAFMGWSTELAAQLVSDELLDASPSFPRLMVPVSVLTDGDPKQPMRFVVSHQDDFKVRTSGSIVVTLSELRELAMRDVAVAAALRARLVKGAAAQQSSAAFNDYLLLPLVMPPETEAPDYRILGSKGNVIADPGVSRLYIAVKQPFFDVTPAAALTPLYRPVPFLLRRSHVFLQVSTSPLIKGLTNHGVRDQLAGAYLVIRTFFKTTPSKRDFLDFPDDPAALFQRPATRLGSVTPAVYRRCLTAIQSRLGRETPVQELLFPFAEDGRDIDHELPAGDAGAGKASANGKVADKGVAGKDATGKDGQKKPTSLPTLEDVLKHQSKRKAAADGSATPSVMSPSDGFSDDFEGNDGGIDLLERAPGKRRVAGEGKPLRGEMEPDQYQEVTVHATTVKHQNGVLTWTFSIPVTVLTGGYGDFDQQIKISVVDALSSRMEKKKERGFMVTTLREMILQGTHRWTLFKATKEEAHVDAEGKPVVLDKKTKKEAEKRDRERQKAADENRKNGVADPNEEEFPSASALIKTPVPENPSLEHGVTRVRTAAGGAGVAAPLTEDEPLSPTSGGPRVSRRFQYGVDSAKPSNVNTPAPSQPQTREHSTADRATEKERKKAAKAEKESLVLSLPPEAIAHPEAYPGFKPVGYLVFNRVMCFSYAHDIENAARRVIAHDAGLACVHDLHYGTTSGDGIRAATPQGVLRPFPEEVDAPADGFGAGRFRSQNNDSGHLALPGGRFGARTPVGLRRPGSSMGTHRRSAGFVQSVCPLDTITSMLLEQARVSGALGNLKNQTPFEVYRAQRDLVKLKTLEGDILPPLAYAYIAHLCVPRTVALAPLLEAQAAAAAAPSQSTALVEAGKEPEGASAQSVHGPITLAAVDRGQFASIVIPASSMSSGGSAGSAVAHRDKVLSGNASNLHGTSSAPTALSADDEHFFRLSSTFSGWLTSRRYELYHQWAVNAVMVPSKGSYQLEIYAWRAGRYELFKVSPRTEAKRNGDIFTVSFVPLTMQGLGVLENHKLKPKSTAAMPQLSEIAARQGRLDALCGQAGVVEDDNDIAEGEISAETFAGLSPQDQAEFVTGDVRFGYSHRVLIALSKPAESGFRGSAADKTTMGPAYNGFLAPDEAMIKPTTLRVPLCIFAQPGGEAAASTIDAFASAPKTRGRPANIIANNERSVRLRAHVEHLGFTEVFFEDIRDEAHAQLEKQPEDRGRCVAPSASGGAGASTVKTAKDGTKVAESVFWTKEALDHPVALALPLCDPYGSLAHPALEIRSIAVAPALSIKDEKAAQKVAKDRRVKHEARSAANSAIASPRGSVVSPRGPIPSRN